MRCLQGMERRRVKKGELPWNSKKLKKDVQDSLSVMLSISEEMDDERVEASVNEMLKEYVW